MCHIFWFPVWFKVFSIYFRSSESCIYRPFNKSGATRTRALDLPKAFNRVWHAGLLLKLKSYEILGQIVDLISSFLSNRWVHLVLDGKSSQEYPINAGPLQGSILVPILFLLYINDFPNAIFNIYADETTFYSKSIRHLIRGNNLQRLCGLG